MCQWRSYDVVLDVGILEEFRTQLGSCDVVLTCYVANIVSAFLSTMQLRKAFYQQVVSCTPDM